MRRRELLTYLAVAPLLPALAGADAGETPWILVDTAAGHAEVRRAEDTILILPDLSFGRGGTSRLHLRGDHTTPLGDFRVTRIKLDSRYHVFVGLDYPTLEHLDEANRRGLIDDAAYADAIRRGHRRGQLPQDTPLGGYIGLHGLGEADPAIHRRLNWTQGCVAMTDAQIEALLEHVRVGTRVVIR